MHHSDAITIAMTQQEATDELIASLAADNDRDRECTWCDPGECECCGCGVDDLNGRRYECQAHAEGRL